MDVGQWFGPSVATGALKYVFLSRQIGMFNINLNKKKTCYRRLVNDFPGAGIGISVAKNGVLLETDVFRICHLQ